MFYPTVGIDVAKHTLQAALLLNGKLKQKSCPNTPVGFKQLLNWLERHAGSTVHACLEATGRYHEGVASALHEAGHTVSVLNPVIIKSYAQCRLARTKTDPSDAALLAEFCFKERPAPWQPPAPEFRDLQELVRHAQALEESLQAAQNQLGAGLRCEQVLSSLNRLIEDLSQHIRAVWKQIDRLVASKPKLRWHSELLVSIPGIGKKTAAVILAEVQDISRFKDVRQLVAYAGLCPKERQSGTSVRGKTQLSKTGNARLRRALYMPALVAKRWNPLLNATAERLAAAGKTKMAVIGALMRKLLHLAYGVLKNNRPFEIGFTPCQAR